MRFGRVSLFLAGLFVPLLPGCAVGAGDRAPAWRLADIAGDPHTLADYRGRVVLLDFWATWCPPCIAASPELQALHEKYAERGFAVIGIHYNDTGDPAGYARKHGYTFPSMTSGRQVARAYGVSQIPTLVLVGKDGTIIHRQLGFDPSDVPELEGKIEAALGG